MNERIQELYEQANGPNPFFGQLKGQMVLTGNDAVEKFAELIVKECAQIADECVVRDLNFPGEFIKDYFGVK